MIKVNHIQPNHNQQLPTPGPTQKIINKKNILFHFKRCSYRATPAAIWVFCLTLAAEKLMNPFLVCSGESGARGTPGAESCFSTTSSRTLHK